MLYQNLQSHLYYDMVAIFFNNTTVEVIIYNCYTGEYYGSFNNLNNKNTLMSL